MITSAQTNTCVPFETVDVPRAAMTPAESEPRRVRDVTGSQNHLSILEYHPGTSCRLGCVFCYRDGTSMSTRRIVSEAARRKHPRRTHRATSLAIIGTISRPRWRPSTGGGARSGEPDLSRLPWTSAGRSKCS